MNRGIKLTVIAAFTILGYVLVTSFNFKKKGCDRETLLEAAKEQLNKFILLQDFPFSFKKSKKSATPETEKKMITLNRGVRYKFFTVRNEELDGEPVLTIYNDANMSVMLGSTYNRRQSKFYEKIEFECKSTGNYCLAFSFLEGKEGCALGVFASNVKE